MPAAKPSTKKTVFARFRLRISVGETLAIGPGKIALLEAVGKTGSITAAARSINMSYRRAWLLLDELNSSLKKPALQSAQGGQHGGGTELTAVGQALIERYRRIELTASKACAEDIKGLTALLVK
jgi:molybdate transport system regulatory protein